MEVWSELINNPYQVIKHITILHFRGSFSTPTL